MKKKNYLPRSEGSKASWIQNFAAKLPTYAAKYNIAPGDVTDVQVGALCWLYWIDCSHQQKEYAKKLTAFKLGLADGSSGSLTAPVPPVLTVAPTLASAGIFGRVAAIVDGIKKKTIYTQDDGLDLGIIGSDVAPADIATMKPAISARIVTDGRPQIVWTKGGNDGVEIQVDKGNGTWQFSGIDMKPNYTDNSTMPTLGQSQLWRYRAIYIANDKHIGLWCDPVSIAVVGVV
jgi:hypothetical protein